MHGTSMVVTCMVRSWWWRAWHGHGDGRHIIQSRWWQFVMHYQRSEQFESRHMNTDQFTPFSHGKNSEFVMESVMTFISCYQYSVVVFTELQLSYFLQRVSTESYFKFNLQRFFLQNWLWFSTDFFKKLRNTVP